MNDSRLAYHIVVANVLITLYLSYRNVRWSWWFYTCCITFTEPVHMIICSRLSVCVIVLPTRWHRIQRRKKREMKTMFRIYSTVTTANPLKLNRRGADLKQKVSKSFQIEKPACESQWWSNHGKAQLMVTESSRVVSWARLHAFNSCLRPQKISFSVSFALHP